ncbi:MAG: hypothetical protein BWX72_00429 [Firmicutes bacterium ADurb.Bin080]|jgi:hypothetical protein|nr:MAG: hypothetical protein BWX72_00429 [Firmicutes bacterium ADurb.Bin080]
MNKFDLNIEKILENWEICHALREIIANALDEQVLSNTENIKIFKDSNEIWHIRDYGRGINIENFTQNESIEKKGKDGIIGKFGIGLKDALATLNRNGVEVKIKSKYGNFSIGYSQKTGFEQISTLHIYFDQDYDEAFIGTEFILSNISESDMQKAKSMFTFFNKETVLENTIYGDVLKKQSEIANIYINGVKAAEEENFLFSYNITNLSNSIRKALNRERNNVGRAAYSDRIKSILLSCNSWEVANELTVDLSNFSYGKKHDELNWIDVQEHAAKILSKIEPVVFVTSNEIERATDLVEQAKDSGHKIVVIPEVLKERVTDVSTTKTQIVSQQQIQTNPEIVKQLKQEGNDVIIVPDEIKERAKDIESKSSGKVQVFSNYVNQRMENYQFKFVEKDKLEKEESQNYIKSLEILKIINQHSTNTIRDDDIFISETMQKDKITFLPCNALHDSEKNRIILKRSILSDRETLISNLLHEAAHMYSNEPDSTRGFEMELTRLIGILGEYIAQNNKKPFFLFR